MISPMCRVCLCRNTRLHIIENTLLQTMFEKLSGSELITADGRSKLICYLCRAHLWRCWKLQEMSQNAENVLSQFLHSGLQVIERSHYLSVSTTKFASMPEYVKNEDPEIYVKEEMTMKTFSVEVQTEGNPAIETPLEFGFMTSANTLKQEQNSEFDDNLLDVDSSYLSILSQLQLEKTNDTLNKPPGKVRKTMKSSNVKSYNGVMSDKPKTNDKRDKHRGATMYVCDTCNKSFNHRGTLHLHMRTHTGDKPHACDKCSKRFSQKGTLLRHIRMHTGEKPYACDRCTKTFNQESSLKRHIKMHNGVKPYACNRCGKAYYESSHLTRHLRTHTGEKPYACDRCFQTFSQSSNLQSHMKKHTGDTPSNYVCHECNKAFDHKSIFKRHILKHTREKPYPCNRCDKKYADKRTLKRHIATHDLS